MKKLLNWNVGLTALVLISGWVMYKLLIFLQYPNANFPISFLLVMCVVCFYLTITVISKRGNPYLFMLGPISVIVAGVVYIQKDVTVLVTALIAATLNTGFFVKVIMSPEALTEQKRLLWLAALPGTGLALWIWFQGKDLLKWAKS